MCHSKVVGVYLSQSSSRQQFQNHRTRNSINLFTNKTLNSLFDQLKVYKWEISLKWVWNLSKNSENDHFRLELSNISGGCMPSNSHRKLTPSTLAVHSFFKILDPPLSSHKSFLIVWPCAVSILKFFLKHLKRVLQFCLHKSFQCK